MVNNDIIKRAKEGTLKLTTVVVEIAFILIICLIFLYIASLITVMITANIPFLAPVTAQPNPNRVTPKKFLGGALRFAACIVLNAVPGGGLIRGIVNWAGNRRNANRINLGGGGRRSELVDIADGDVTPGLNFREWIPELPQASEELQELLSRVLNEVKNGEFHFSSLTETPQGFNGFSIFAHVVILAAVYGAVVKIFLYFVDTFYYSSKKLLSTTYSIKKDLDAVVPARKALKEAKAKKEQEPSIDVNIDQIPEYTEPEDPVEDIWL